MGLDKLVKMVDEMEQLSKGMIELPFLPLLRDVITNFQEGKMAKAQDTANQAYDDMEYIWNAINSSSGTIRELWKIKDLIGEVEEVLITNGLARPTPFGAGATAALMVDIQLPPEKRAYPVLLEKLMEAAEKEK